MKKIILAMSAAAALLMGTIGYTFAQSATSPAAPTPAKQQRLAVLSDAAAKLGLTTDQLQQALAQARKDLGVKHDHPQLAKLVRAELPIAAKAIGLPDVKALRGELAGATLTAVAQKHNVQPATVAAAVKSDVDAKIQAMADAGTVKADRVTALKQRAEAKVDALMTRQFPVRKAASGG